MERIWQWAWDRYGPRYMWFGATVAFLVSLPIYGVFLSLPIVAFEGSGRRVEAVVITVAAVALLVGILVIPGYRLFVPAQRWAAGHRVDRVSALEGTYAYVRKASTRAVWATGAWAAGLSVAIGAVSGATSPRLAQYAVLGAAVGMGVQLIAFHSIIEGMMRPARVALVADSDIGDSLPRSRPTFATRSNISMVAVAFGFAMVGALVAAVVNRVNDVPILAVVIGAGLAVVYAVPISVGIGFSPSLQPIRDLAAGADRVAAGDYGRRLPVVQDDDLGALAGSFNRMQAGLVERQRLQGAFGTYVDPVLASRLLEQGDDVFTGERREVTVMFVDIRDFTPFAESNSAEDTVSRLNALFEI
ncbi:MAG TPA: HAMP domain-containing protein, partial [Mycobacterium sp.]|nr:HAMP domain-containing protein [Mycobacterium sp.]